MDRDSKRERIKAAREWLGQADDSLGKSDDLKGDLKLMLAKAELEGAGPGTKTRKLRKWVSRGAALAVALAIVAVARNWPLEQEQSMETVQGPAAGIEELAAPAGGEKAKPEVEVKVGAVPEPETSKEPQTREILPAAQEDGEAESVGPHEGMMEAGSPQAAVSPHLTYEPPRVPAPEKQRLMQEAGEILRR